MSSDKKNNESRSKGKCFKCSERGHMKNDCPRDIDTDKEDLNSLLVGCVFTNEMKDEFEDESGSTVHSVKVRNGSKMNVVRKEDSTGDTPKLNGIVEHGLTIRWEKAKLLIDKGSAGDTPELNGIGEHGLAIRWEKAKILNREDNAGAIFLVKKKQVGERKKHEEEINHGMPNLREKIFDEDGILTKIFSGGMSDGVSVI